ncbi:hypothetical protein ACFQZE_06650 [Paenibacillus sp. GCM10027627]|uniref:hypothetical protein n=1 Tax=unclassified Paenibacillus TaxID=185978 RepID=UPI00362882F8
MSYWKDEVAKINKCPQRQDSVTDQMLDLISIANLLGFYDAADYIKRTFSKEKSTARVGDRILINGNSNNHPFELGQEVVVVDWYEFEVKDSEMGVEVKAFSGEDSWFIRHTDYILKC